MTSVKYKDQKIKHCINYENYSHVKLIRNTLSETQFEPLDCTFHMILSKKKKKVKNNSIPVY